MVRMASSAFIHRRIDVMSRPRKSAAQFAEILVRNLEHHEAGHITARECMAFAREIWSEVVALGMDCEVALAIDSRGGGSDEVPG
jgi:hypothetical protein